MKPENLSEQLPISELGKWMEATYELGCDFLEICVQMNPGLAINGLQTVAKRREQPPQWPEQSRVFAQLHELNQASNTGFEPGARLVAGRCQFFARASERLPRRGGDRWL